MFISSFGIPDDLKALAQDEPAFLKKLRINLDLNGKGARLLADYDQDYAFQKLFAELAFFAFAPDGRALCYFVFGKTNASNAPIALLNSEGNFSFLGENIADSLVRYTADFSELIDPEKSAVIQSISDWSRRHGIEQILSPKQIAARVRKIKTSPNFRLSQFQNEEG